jgi:cytochrome c biogenesis protein CcdA
VLALLGGFSAGLVHVVSGPDHWAAVAPLAVDAHAGRGGPRWIPAWRIGAAWGLGHGLAVAAVAALGQAARGRLGMERWSEYAEQFVGFLLVGLALWTWRRSSRLSAHEHVHVHAGLGGHAHLHLHDTAGHEAPHPHPQHRHAHGPAAIAIGLLHGLAGAGHWVAASPTLLLERGEAVRYVAGYWIAAILAMAVFAGLIGRLVEKMGPRALPRLLRGVAILAAGVGLVWIGLAFR